MSARGPGSTGRLRTPRRTSSSRRSSPSRSMARLELREITKRFGRAVAVDQVSLAVTDGEFLTLLGPSGCGKTTTLRIVAGLVDPDEGEVLLDGTPMQHLPAHRRQTAMVFQSYALFPHMTVQENIGFGLRMRGMMPEPIRTHVQEALALVELEGLGDRYPRQLSGGQQQRVAVARAIVTRPKVLLFDEPLSNLDAKLRERLRLELRALQQRLGVTTVYVTHDQAEALALSDRVAVMFGGKVVEIGTPRQVYRTPRARVTAEFLGVTNFLDGKVAAVTEGHCIVQTPLGIVEADAALGVRVGEVVTLSFRPEDVRVGRYEGTAITGRVRHASYLGSVTDYVVESAGITLRVHEAGGSSRGPGEEITITLPGTAAIVRGD